VAALLAGLAASYLFSLVQPKFHDAHGLKNAVARPVLGTVSLIRSPEVMQRRRFHALAFFGGVGGLATAYGGILAFVFLRSLLNI
jgi:hypothetical protein